MFPTRQYPVITYLGMTSWRYNAIDCVYNDNNRIPSVDECRNHMLPQLLCNNKYSRKDTLFDHLRKVHHIDSRDLFLNWAQSSTSSSATQVLDGPPSAEHHTDGNNDLPKVSGYQQPVSWIPFNGGEIDYIMDLQGNIISQHQDFKVLIKKRGSTCCCPASPGRGTKSWYRYSWLVVNSYGHL